MLSPMLAKLNVETREFHAPSDIPWLDLIDETAGLTHVHYARYLIQRYGFEAPLEAALAYTPELDGFIDIQPRCRAGLIAQDLIQLGLSPGDVAGIEQSMIAPFTTPAEAFGWLYVHERNTLIFDQLVSELRRRLPEVTDAMAYLRSNEGRISAEWDGFRQALDRVVHTPDAEWQVIDAARHAFRAARQWQLGRVIDNPSLN